MSNEVMTKTTTAIDELTGEVTTMYCSIVPQDDKDKARIFNAINNTDERIADHKNEVINVTDVIAHTVEMADEQGNMIPQTRVILVDDKGKTYGATSTGMMSALKMIFPIVGMPPYSKPLPLKIVEKTGRRGYRFLSVAIEYK